MVESVPTWMDFNEHVGEENRGDEEALGRNDVEGRNVKGHILSCQT